VTGPLILIPASARRVVDRCRICKAPRLEHETQRSWESHITRCLAEHHDELMAERRRRHPDILKPWDPEYAAWIQDPARRRGLMDGSIKP